MHSSVFNQVIRGMAVAGIVVSLAACSSPPKPKAELALSANALETAEQAGAREYAPVELRRARELNQAALAAVQKEKMSSAKLLAERAVADAELARAIANAEKSQQALKELQDGIELMRTEIQRVQVN